MCACVSTVMSGSLQPQELQPTRLLCLWDSPGKNSGVGCHASSRGTFQPRDQTSVSYDSWRAGRFFGSTATSEAQVMYNIQQSIFRFALVSSL